MEEDDGEYQSSRQVVECSGTPAVKCYTKLTGNDLFNGGINRFTLYSNRMMFRKMEDNDSRCIQLSLRYRFLNEQRARGWLLG